MPGSPEQDSDSDVGPTTSESESDDELGMTANGALPFACLAGAVSTLTRTFRDQSAWI